MLVKYVTQKRMNGKNFLTPVYLHTTHQSMIHLNFPPFELMFFRKAVLSIDINTEANDVEIILIDFNANVLTYEM